MMEYFPHFDQPYHFHVKVMTSDGEQDIRKIVANEYEINMMRLFTLFIVFWLGWYVGAINQLRCIWLVKKKDANLVWWASCGVFGYWLQGNLTGCKE